MKCQNSSKNKSVQASYFLQGWCSMFIEMVLQLCLLWWETFHHLLVSLCRTAAAAWGCPAVNLVVGLAQWQVSALPVTAALCSSNHQEAKISDAAQKEAEKKAVGQNKRIHTQQDSHTYNHSGLIPKHFDFQCDRQLCEIRLLMEEKQSVCSKGRRLITSSMLGRRHCSHRKWDQVLQSCNSTFIYHSDPAEKSCSRLVHEKPHRGGVHGYSLGHLWLRGQPVAWWFTYKP